MPQTQLLRLKYAPQITLLSTLTLAHRMEFHINVMEILEHLHKEFNLISILQA